MRAQCVYLKRHEFVFHRLWAIITTSKRFASITNEIRASTHEYNCILRMLHFTFKRLLSMRLMIVTFYDIFKVYISIYVYFHSSSNEIWTLIMGKFEQGCFHNIIQEYDHEPYHRMKLLLLEISKRNMLLLRLAPILENAWV